MYPARTPTGTELAPMLDRRLDEVRLDGLLFPSPRGHWPRRSTYRRNTFNPAATAAGWLRSRRGSKEANSTNPHQECPS